MLIKLVNHNVLGNGILYNLSPDSVWKGVVNLVDAVNYYGGISHYVSLLPFAQFRTYSRFSWHWVSNNPREMKNAQKKNQE